MLTTNPFVSLGLSETIMQGYVILMFLLVIGATLIDVIHKKSAVYFSENMKKQQQKEIVRGILIWDFSMQRENFWNKEKASR